MALNTYMKATGAVQGAITGDVTQQSNRGAIRVLAFSYGVLGGHDAATGLPTGKRQHQPVQVTTPTGPQTPKLFQAAVTNETLKTVELDVYGPNAGGIETKLFVLALTNAIVTEFDLAEDASGTTGALADQWSFTFQKITLTWTIPNVTASDDWESPVS